MCAAGVLCWCLMMWDGRQVIPDCIRTFDSYEWCMEDLRRMDMDEYTTLRFSCHKEDIWAPFLNES